MALPAMTGNFNLTKQAIDQAVTKKSAGVYNLGYVSGNTFYVQRVGRSDTDLNARLKKYEGEYVAFQYAYCTSPQAAFYAECELWHQYGGTNNPLHPDRPADTNWNCPRCDKFN